VPLSTIAHFDLVKRQLPCQTSAPAKFLKFKGDSGVSIREAMLKVESVNFSLTVEAAARGTRVQNQQTREDWAGQDEPLSLLW
jgi:hypothetical protein